jgi:cytochrome o ubiquinol oxidase subunit II
MSRRFRHSLSAGAVCFAAATLGGCKLTLFDPAGQVGLDEKNLILTSTALMLIVVVPVIVLTLVFAFHYRASNKHAKYAPEWTHSTRIEAIVWSIPCLIVVAMGVIAWQSTHALDPYKPLASKARPIVIDVVALDWKWLFIYPEQRIATVNQVAFPAGVPVEFHITSDSVMNSFFIPQLGSQIYAMAGMETKLHLIADRPGRYDGISANFSGSGFSGMKFQAIAGTPKDFAAWVATVKRAPHSLDGAAYAQLAKPSENHPVEYFSAADPGQFRAVLDKYRSGDSGHGLSPHTAMPGMD